VNLSICDVCDDYCDIYDVYDDYCDIYDVCDQYYDIYDIPAFLGIFKREKQKKNKLQWSLRQSDQNQQQKQCLCRAFIETHDKGAIYCRAFCSPAHGKKRSLPCILFPGTRQRGLFAMRFLPRRTAKISSLPCVLLPDARQRVSHAI
jgi:hypothetical protein